MKIWDLKYDGKAMFNGFYNTGPLLADDSWGITGEDSRMLLMSNTNETEYYAYLAKLQGLGFETVFENHTPVLDCCQLEKDDKLIYVYLTRPTNQVRIIEDRAGVSVKEFSYVTEDTGSAEIYQYGLYYDPENHNTDTTVNCGMFYIIRLNDNSLVMIDGGHYMQCSDEAVRGMYQFLRKITGIKEHEKIRIAAWYFTHAHDDHMAACVRLLRTYPEVFHVERIMFNFPSFSVRFGDMDILILKETLREYCPDAKCLKLHNGQVITLANTRFEVMYTHEDAVTAECPTMFPFRDFNCTSTVLKMTTGGGSIMWLGDTNVEAEELMVKIMPPELWKADVVQVAHHCFNFLSRLYPLIDADYAMLPNSHYGGDAGSNHDKRMDVEKCLSSPDHIWYEDQTTGFRFENGEYHVILEEPVIGGEHDGVNLYGVSAAEKE